MNKQHIAHSSTSNRQKHLPFPQMQTDCRDYCNKFRNTMAAVQYIYISQTIYHQHTKYSGRKHLANVIYKCWYFFPSSNSKNVQQFQKKLDKSIVAWYTRCKSDFVSNFDKTKCSTIKSLYKLGAGQFPFFRIKFIQVS